MRAINWEFIVRSVNSLPLCVSNHRPNPLSVVIDCEIVLAFHLTFFWLRDKFWYHSPPSYQWGIPPPISLSSFCTPLTCLQVDRLVCRLRPELFRCVAFLLSFEFDLIRSCPDSESDNHIWLAAIGYINRLFDSIFLLANVVAILKTQLILRDIRYVII